MGRLVGSLALQLCLWNKQCSVAWPPLGRIVKSLKDPLAEQSSGSNLSKIKMGVGRDSGILRGCNSRWHWTHNLVTNCLGCHGIIGTSSSFQMSRSEKVLPAWLTAHQAERSKESATWPKKHFTGTGFPSCLYLEYSYYPHYFPMMTLRRFIKESQKQSR
jgi:hypothetical protein